MSLNKIDSEVPTVPTKSRVQALLINRSPYYSIKLVIGLGIALTTCGIILCIFGFVYALIETQTLFACIYCEAGIGVWVVVNGLITIISGSRPHSTCQLYIYLLSSLITIAVTGVLSILRINSVIQESDYENISDITKNDNLELMYNSPTILINLLMLTFSTLSFIISVVNFCISSHKLCQCYSHNKFGQNFLTNSNLDPDSLCRRDRILQWIVQQSDLQFNKSLTIATNDKISYISRKKLEPLNSSSTTSTRLSAYDT
jgi:hypothetical protein